jgi:hypothetical protein
MLPGFEHLQKHKRISGITVLRDGLLGYEMLRDLINQASKQERTKEKERKDSEF